MITFTQFRNSKLIIVFALLFGIQIKGLCVAITYVDPNNDGIALSFNPRGQQYNNFMRYNCSEEERLVASLKAGETLNFGFQFQYGELNALNNLTGDVWG